MQQCGTGLGHTFRLGQPNEEPKLIVGVVKDSKYFTLGEKQQLAVYEPYFASDEPATLNFIVRTRSSPDKYVRAISNTPGRLDTTAAIETKPMSRALGLALLPSQAGALFATLVPATRAIRVDPLVALRYE